MDIHHKESAHLGRTRRITVSTPPRTGRDRAPLPVLYLNDGQNLFEAERAFAGVSWRAADTAMGLIRRRAIPPLVIVGIDHGGANRAREFLPVRDDRNPDVRDVIAHRYARFVRFDVMPFVERTYPVARGAANTGVGGSSYGAIAALLAAFTFPGVFGRLLLESPSLYVGNGHMLRMARRARRWPGRVYLGVGTAETRHPGINDETVRNVGALEKVLRRARLGPRRLRVIVDEGAAHCEPAWASRFPAALEFLFG